MAGISSKYTEEYKKLIRHTQPFSKNSRMILYVSK